MDRVLNLMSTDVEERGANTFANAFGKLFTNEQILKLTVNCFLICMTKGRRR